MSWDGTIYLNGNGGISSMGGLLGCASGSVTPIPPSGYRFFSAAGYVGGLEPSQGALITKSYNSAWGTQSTLNGSVVPYTYMPFRMSAGYQVPNSYTGNTWDIGGISGSQVTAGGVPPASYEGWERFHEWGHCFVPLGAKDFYLSGGAGFACRSHSGTGTYVAGTGDMRLMDPAYSESGASANVGTSFGTASATSRYVETFGWWMYEQQRMYFEKSWSNFRTMDTTVRKTPLCVSVLGFANNGKTTGNLNGLCIIGGTRWSASGFAPLSAY